MHVELSVHYKLLLCICSRHNIPAKTLLKIKYLTKPFPFQTIACRSLTLLGSVTGADITNDLCLEFSTACQKYMFTRLCFIVW